MKTILMILALVALVGCKPVYDTPVLPQTENISIPQTEVVDVSNDLTPDQKKLEADLEAVKQKQADDAKLLRDQNKAAFEQKRADHLANPGQLYSIKTDASGNTSVTPIDRPESNANP